MIKKPCPICNVDCKVTFWIWHRTNYPSKYSVVEVDLGK